MESGSGLSLSLAAVLLGRQRSDEAGWRWRGGVAWQSARMEVASRGRAPDGLGWDPDGLGRARVAQFVVLPGGGDDDSAWLGRRQGRHVAAGLSELYGPVWA
jgi:hypothetical protein